MRYAIAALLMLAVLAMGAPWDTYATDDNILMVEDGLLWDVQQSNAGIGGYRETAVGADTVFVAFDPSSATYDHAEVYIEFTADRANGLAGEGTVRNVAVYWLQSLAYSARTVTAGNKLSLVDLNSEGGVTEYAYRTITPDSTSYANKVMIANIAGENGESTGVLGPFWIDANAAADSTCSGFVLITADTVGVSWQALIIPRT